MEVKVDEVTVESIGERSPFPPKYFKAIQMNIRIAGKGITPKKMDRAISLSQEKY